MLREQFVFDQSPARWVWPRELGPCVAELWRVLDKDVCCLGLTTRCPSTTPTFAAAAASGTLVATPGDAGPLGMHSRLLSKAEGDSAGAMAVAREALAFNKRVLPADQTAIVTSMNNLAATHGALGWHVEALELQQQTLAFNKWVLPADHPAIAESPNDLAATCGALGRHAEALELQQRTLAFNKRMMPADHPKIATSMGNLTSTHNALGRHAEALELLQQTLAFRQRVLPTDHPDVATSMNNLAVTCGALGWRIEALELLTDVLTIQTRSLSADHPDVANERLDRTRREVEALEKMPTQHWMLPLRFCVTPELDFWCRATAPSQNSTAIADVDRRIVATLQRAMHLVVDSERLEAVPANCEALMFTDDLTSADALQL